VVNETVTAVLRGSGFDQTGGSDIRGVIGDAYVRTLLTCANPTAGNYDATAVIPVSLQLPPNRIVQLGWVNCGAVSGGMCGNIPEDGLHFFYVCDDNSNGVGCVADSWAGLPETGDRYRFKVLYDSANDQWDYSIENVTEGWTKSKSISASWSQGNGAWWGAEDANTGSTLGPAHSGSNDINMYWMQYKRASVGSWQVVTDIEATNSVGEFGPQPSWYHEPVYNQNHTDDAINIWTELH
jgi:hypothetical protein